MLNLKGKKVFVTGADGFIGSHLVEKLVDMNCDVKALCLYNIKNSIGNLDFLPDEKKKKITFIHGDTRDPFMMHNVIKDVDVVFHLAALISVPYSYRAPASFIQTNVEGTVNVMQACLDSGVKKIVHTSTSECYGTALYAPIDEKHPLQAQSPYAASKIAGDKMVESYHCTYGLPVATIRPFNTFGPRQSARAVIPSIISQALKFKKITLGSLHPKRDYTFVKDTAEGFIKMAECEDSIGQTINIGSNTEISIGELAQKIADLIGGDISISETDHTRVRPDKSEVLRLLADNSKAKKIINWKPEYSLDAGLMETIEWISKNLDEFKSEGYLV